MIHPKLDIGGSTSNCTCWILNSTQRGHAVRTSSCTLVIKQISQINETPGRCNHVSNIPGVLWWYECFCADLLTKVIAALSLTLKRQSSRQDCGQKMRKMPIFGWLEILQLLLIYLTVFSLLILKETKLTLNKKYSLKKSTPPKYP